jgi:release factor glutamine methyltransferase
MSEGGRTLSALLQDARSRFMQAGLDDPAGDARVLVLGLLDLSSLDLATRGDEPVDPARAERVAQAVERRLCHEPVHRILGEREFYGLPMRLSAGTLEPRPDTEILVDCMLVHLRHLAIAHPTIHILDLGTGSGAIGLALLHECPNADGVGVDISTDALEAAKENAARNGLTERFQVLQGSWFEAVNSQFHAIVSNPPYIETSVIPTLAPEVRLFDPPAALDGGTDGLDAYRAIARDAERFLLPDGIVGLEIGYDQRVAVTAIFEEAGFVLIEAARDYGHNDRALVFGRGDQQGRP